ncbi:MAG: tetratricopeptide repeat protein [Planctomycetia bacterium]|nr:tetratricopeptide repeat protein [Planctomycetia bacterium]
MGFRRNGNLARAACARHGPVWCALASLSAVAALLPATRARGEDVAYVELGGASGGVAKLTGEITEFNGKSLSMRLSTGHDRTFDARTVQRVEYPRSPQHETAEKLFRANQFQAALSAYQQAIKTEQRRFVRREIISRLVRCYQNLDNIEAAGEFFLTLAEDDPFLLHLDAIPLAWAPDATSPNLEQKAQEWLKRGPAGVLLGASHLMTTQRTLALQHLSDLRFDKDKRLAALALAQTWRAEGAVGERQTKEWTADTEKMPENFRYGAFYVLGTAHARTGGHEQAAICFLRVGILYTPQRGLAAHCLVEAGRALEKAGQNQEASRLFQEVAGQYGDTRAAAQLRRTTGGPPAGTN